MEVKETKNLSIKEASNFFSSVDERKMNLQYRVLQMNPPSKYWMKMVLLGEEMGDNFNNTFIDSVMNLSPQRQDNETKEEFKERSLLSKYLLKYRSSLYEYPNVPKRYSSKREKKLLKLAA